MTTIDICPLDGYPTTIAHVCDGAAHVACTNPWHPVRPTPCPHCATHRAPNAVTLPHELRPDAVCRSCGRMWLPGHQRA